MNYRQYLLIKLAEECNEIAQMAIKTALFGENSIDPRENTGETNIEKLGKEMLDGAAVIDELQQTGFRVGDTDVDEYISKKRTKLKHYFEVSKGESVND